MELNTPLHSILTAVIGCWHVHVPRCTIHTRYLSLSHASGLRRRGLQQFTPSTFEIFDWAIFSSPMRFLQAHALVAMTLAFELNAFFLKTLLWLPPPHFLNVSRLLFLWALALPAVKEYHVFLEVCIMCSLCKACLHQSALYGCAAFIMCPTRSCMP